MKRYFSLVFVSVLSCFGLISCVSKSVDNDIASLKSRMMQLENTLNSGKTTFTEKSDLDSKNILAISSSIEEINVQLQKINGDLDYIKTAIKLSSDSESEGDSSNFTDGSTPIGEVVASLNQKVNSLEESHSALMETLKSQLGSSSSSKSEKVTLKSATDVQHAYNQKKYSAIIDEAPGLYKKAKTKQEKGDILYYLAESLFKQGQLNESALKFNELIEIKQKVTTAKLRLGDVFYKLGDKSTAKLYYQDLLDNHSKSKEARTAKEKLDTITKQTSLRSDSSKKTSHSTQKRTTNSKRL